MKNPIILICLLIFQFALAGLCVADGMKNVVLMETMPVPTVLLNSKTFRSELKKLGYEEGKNLKLTILKPNGDKILAEKMLREYLASNQPDLVATIATMASQIAVKLLKSTKTPILFFQVSDPVGAGIVDQIGKATGTNITGIVHTVSRKSKIDIVMRLVLPITKARPVKFGFIHSSYPSAMGDIRELRRISQNREDLIFLPYSIPYRKVPAGTAGMIRDTQKAIGVLKEKVNFWWEPQGPLGEIKEYTHTLQKKSKIPIIMGENLDSVKMGALIHISPNIISSGKEVAMLAHAILNGKDPGQIPVVPPSNFTLGINLTTALRLGIIIPPDILELADKNIYR